MPGDVARASRALAVDNAEQAASRSKPGKAGVGSTTRSRKPYQQPRRDRRIAFPAERTDKSGRDRDRHEKLGSIDRADDLAGSPPDEAEAADEFEVAVGLRPPNTRSISGSPVIALSGRACAGWLASIQSKIAPGTSIAQARSSP